MPTLDVFEVGSEIEVIINKGGMEIGKK